MKKISCVFNDNNIPINVDNWGDRGKQSLVRILSVGHLQYNIFKHNFSCFIYLNKTLNTSFSRVGETLASNVRNICHYLAESYEGCVCFN